MSCYDDYEPDGWDGPDGDDPVMIPCPYCREPVFEDLIRCPRCENYLSREDAPPARKPWWIILGLLLALAVALMWVFGALRF
jgi:hypothetical protein